MVGQAEGARREMSGSKDPRSKLRGIDPLGRNRPMFQKRAEERGRKFLPFTSLAWIHHSFFGEAENFTRFRPNALWGDGIPVQNRNPIWIFQSGNAHVRQGNLVFRFHRFVAQQQPTLQTELCSLLRIYQTWPTIDAHRGPAIYFGQQCLRHPRSGSCPIPVLVD